jgi:phosphoribosylglycinamide formyltransferase 1
MPLEPPDHAFLWDMLRYSRMVVDLTKGLDLEAFRRNLTTRLATERAIEIVGEASRNISELCKKSNPHVAWRAIAAQRHILAHEYAEVDIAKIWSVVTIHIPQLIKQLDVLVFRRLCCMISGGGRTVLNLLDVINRGELNAHISLVIASGPCTGIERCRARGLRVIEMPGTIPAEQLGAVLTENAIDFVVLAGYLKMVRIPAGFEGKIVNIHPALLPKFAGKGMHGNHVHEAVIAAKQSQSGCTVHLVDAHYDTGPIILQRTCPVLPTDTAQTLAARVFDLECQAYPEALRKLLN